MTFWYLPSSTARDRVKPVTADFVALLASLSKCEPVLWEGKDRKQGEWDNQALSSQKLSRFFMSRPATDEGMRSLRRTLTVLVGASGEPPTCKQRFLVP